MIDLKNSQLRQDLPISKNDRVVLPFREGFAKIKSSRKFPNLQYQYFTKVVLNFKEVL